jgi:hypothetical protein
MNVSSWPTWSTKIKDDALVPVDGVSKVCNFLGTWWVLLFTSKPRWVAVPQILHLARCNTYLSKDTENKSFICCIHQLAPHEARKQRRFEVPSMTVNHPR